MNIKGLTTYSPINTYTLYISKVTIPMYNLVNNYCICVTKLEEY